MALVALGVGAAVTHDRLVFLIAPRAAVRVAADAGGVLRAASAGDDQARRARVALPATDRRVRSGRQHEAEIVRVEPGREVRPGVVAGLAVGIEVRRQVVERGEPIGLRSGLLYAFYPFPSPLGVVYTFGRTGSTDVSDIRKIDLLSTGSLAPSSLSDLHPAFSISPSGHSKLAFVALTCQFLQRALQVPFPYD